MIFGALKGAALKKAGPFYEAGGVHETRDPKNFVEFLHRLNSDSTRVSWADDELREKMLVLVESIVVQFLRAKLTILPLNTNHTTPIKILFFDWLNIP